MIFARNHGIVPVLDLFFHSGFVRFKISGLSWELSGDGWARMLKSAPRRSRRRCAIVACLKVSQVLERYVQLAQFQMEQD